MRQIIIVSFCGLALLIGQACNSENYEGPLNAPLVDLIADPRRFEGQQVSTMGFLVEHANLTLFVSEAHAKSRDYLSSFVIGEYDQREISRSSCIGMIVEIVGEIASGTAGGFYMIGVSRITLISSNETCWSTVPNDR